MDKKDWWLDVAATVTALMAVAIFIEIMKGKFHHIGGKIHGRKHDGSKYDKEDEGEGKEAA